MSVIAKNIKIKLICNVNKPFSDIIIKKVYGNEWK